ncbi:hypothetical protein Ancab_038160 [Ancistrocladus abbreviatus]
MSCSNFVIHIYSNPSIKYESSVSFKAQINPFQFRSNSATPFSIAYSTPHDARIHCGIRELRERINTVKNTQKITEAMKLVAAAKVRRAQEAVISGRPFAEALVEMLCNINEQLQSEDIDVPLTDIRIVRKVALVVITGDRGLCGGFHNAVIRKAESRIAELRDLGLDYVVISVGKKGNVFFFKEAQYNS